MEIIKAGDSERISAIRVGPEDDSTMVFIPPDQDPEAETVELTLRYIGARVPIATKRFSIEGWLQLLEEMYYGLIQIGWQPEKAKQILPRGGCDGNIPG